MIELSVVVPIFNSESTLKKCIDSILCQSFKNFEVICVNDGSTDNSLNILNDYKKKDNRIIIVNQANKGLSAARNSGIRIAKGEYVTFIDSDDYIDQDTFAKINDIIKEKYDVIRIDYSINKTEKITKKKKDELYDANKIKHEIVPQILKGTIPSYSWLLYINLSTLRKKEWYFNEDTFYMEDIEYLLNICYTCNSIYFKNEALYNYYINTNGMTKSKKNYKKNMYLTLEIHKKILGILKKYDNNYEQFRKISDTIYANNILNFAFLDYKYNNNIEIFNELQKIINNEQFKEMKQNFQYRLLPVHLRIQLFFAKNNKIECIKKYFNIKNNLTN